MVLAGSYSCNRSATEVGQGAPIPVGEVCRDLVLGGEVAPFPLQLDHRIQPFGLLDRPPEELRHRDDVDLLASGLQPGRQQLDLPPQVPLFLGIVTQDGERQVVVDADPRRHRLQILLQEFNTFFQREHGHTPQLT